MKTFLITIMSLSTISSIYSQDSVRHYLNNELSITDSGNATLIQDIVHENRIYKVTDKEISGKMLKYCEYSSLDPLMENGLAVYYNEPGKISSRGYYINGEITGLWLYYTEDDIDSVDYTQAALYDKNSDCYITEYAKVNNKTEELAQNVVLALKMYLSQNMHFPARTVSKDEYYDIDINFTIGTDGAISCIEFPNVRERDLEVELIRLMKKFFYNDKIIKEPLKINFTLTTPEDVYIIVENMPKFRDGDANEFRKYIEQNLRYPEIAAKKGIQGKVFVQFTVNRKGQVVNVRVVRNVHPLLDEEALRVVKSSPKWTPGKQKGEFVNVQFTFPIAFILN